MTKIAHKELSYEIVGVLFDVYNDLGFGYQEKYYQKAIAVGFKEKNINFIEQAPYLISYKGEVIGRYFLDFLIEGKIVLEIKKAPNFSKKNIDQVNGYLKATGVELAILANFTENGVRYKRMLNLKKHN